jgi:hypothetical protein
MGRWNKKGTRQFLVSVKCIMPPISNQKGCETKEMIWILIYLMSRVNYVLGSEPYASPRGRIEFKDIVWDGAQVDSLVWYE